MSHREPVTTPQEEPTIGKLVVDASRDVSALIKHEIELAKAELKVSVRAGGISIALFAVAGFLGLLAIIMISVAFAYFLTMWFDWDLAWSFLIVFGVYLVVAGLLGVAGVRLIKKVRPPERAIEQGKQIPAAFKRSS
jgi:Putative Actinobacterial Holin-X, holin superfamily III